MNRIRKVFVEVRDFFKGRPPQSCQVRVVDDKVDFESTTSRRDIKSDEIEAHGFNLSIADRVRIRKRGEIVHRRGYFIRDLAKPKPVKPRSRLARLRKAVSRPFRRRTPIIRRQQPGEVNWPIVHGDLTSSTIRSLEDLDSSHQPLVRIHRNASLDAMAASIVRDDEASSPSVIIHDEILRDPREDSALSMSVTSEASDGQQDDSGANLNRNLSDMSGGLGNYVPENRAQVMHDPFCLCHHCFDVSAIPPTDENNRRPSVFENASAPGDLSHATSKAFAEAASEDRNEVPTSDSSESLSLRVSEDNVDEQGSINSNSNASVPDPHDAMCGCPSCYRIGQFDGNDTTDVESDDEGPTASGSAAKFNLPRAPNDPNFETIQTMCNNLDPAWLDLYDAEVKTRAVAEAAARDVLRRDPTKEPREKAAPAKKSTLGLLAKNKKDTRSIKSYFRSSSSRLPVRPLRLPPIATRGKKSSKQLQSWRLRQKLKPVVTLLDEIKDRANQLDAIVDGGESEKTDGKRPTSEAPSAAQSTAPSTSKAPTGDGNVERPRKRPKNDNSGSDSDDDERRQPQKDLPLSRASSYTTIGSGDETDYSDDEDIRNFFVNNRAEELPLMRQDPLFGHETEEPGDESPDRAVDDDLLLSFEGELRARHRPVLGADRSPAENIPDNVEELLHFPTKNVLQLEENEIFERLLSLGAKHHIPLVFMEKTWIVIAEMLEVANGRRPIGFYRMRERVLNSLPQPRLFYTLQHRRTGTIKYVEGKHFKKKTYPISQFRPIMCETRANLHELMEYHAACHKGKRGERLQFEAATKADIPISLYVDGVSPSSTGSMKMICEVVKHDCCNLLLNFNTIVYAKDFTPSAEDLMEGLLSDLSRNKHIKVNLVLCDLPERLRLCCLNNFNGQHGCLTCVSPGVKRVGAPGVIWPASTMNAPLRDDESFVNLAEAARKTGVTVGGHKSKSPLTNIPGFSVTTQVPPDPMHLFGGLTKFMWEKFNKSFLTAHQRKTMTDKISKMYCDIGFPSDFKRKFRPIDAPKFRMNEWKQLVALVGIDIAEEYAKLGFKDVADCWDRYTWIVRMLAQGDVWYRVGSYNGKGLQQEIDKLYKDIDRLLGPQACVPNLHILHHMPHYRKQYRLGKITTERAEAFYGVNRRSFAVQSSSIGKQIHFNTLLAMRQGHACEVEFKFKPKRKPTDMDHLMVDSRRGVHVYLRDSSDGESYVVNKLNCTFFNGRNGYFNWRDAGVLQAVDVSPEETTVRKCDVIAKAVLTKTRRLYIWTRDLHDF